MKKRKIPIMISMVCLILIVILICWQSGCQNGNDDFNDDNGDGVENIIFPHEIEDGKIKIVSLFQSSIENPDGNNEIGENIASLEVLNQSEEYCEKAFITLVLEDGTCLEFEIFDIPAGKTVWAFDIHNTPISRDVTCSKVESKVVFDEQVQVEGISFYVQDTKIVIQNETDKEVTDLILKCHCYFENAYFGGRTYEYLISTIPVKGQIVVEALDCYMGIAEVVKIVKE